MNFAAANLLASDLLQAAIVQLLYSSILAAVVMAGLRLLRVRAPLIREAAWFLVLLRLIVPPGWHFPYSLRGLLDPWIAADQATGGVNSFARAIIVSGRHEAAATTPPLAWQSYAVAGWICCAIAISALLLFRMHHYHRICRRASAVDEPMLLGMLADWKTRHGVRRNVNLLLSDASPSPFTAGSLRPSIVLPQAALALDRRTLDSIIGHEMAHVARWDEVRTFSINLIRTLHFFNPVAWLAAIELGQAREERCDEIVIRSGAVTARDFGRSLMSILKLNHPGQPTVDAIVGLIDRKEGIKMRVVAIQSETLPGIIRPLPILLGTILAAVLLVPMAPADAPQPKRRPVAHEPSEEIFESAGRIHVMIAAQPGMAMPQRVGGADPVYTDLALAEGTSGSVKLEVTVGSDGLVQNVHLIQGLPHGLSEAAIRAAKEWEFEPARQFGDYVEITIQVAIAFGLFDSAPQNLNASVLSEIEPLLPKSTILTSLTSEGELLHIEGTIADSIEATKLLENINNSTSFSQPFLESMTPVDEAIQFHITCERTN